MRRALARFNASTMMSSSIRFSFVGAQVGCTTNTSRARTFCWISTVDFAVGEAADRGLAELDAEVRGDLLRQRRIGVAGEQDGVEQHGRASVAGASVERDLAGEEGLEPSHVGIKIRCLDQLGDSPTQVRRLRAEPRNRLQPSAQPHKRMVRPDCGTATDPARRKLGSRRQRRHGFTRLRRPSRTLRCPNPSSGCCRSGPPATAPPAPPRAAGFGERLQVVATDSASGVCKKARKYSSGACRGRASGWPKTAVRGQRRGGLDHREPLRRHVDRRQPLADALDEGVAPADEERHVGAQRQRQLGQPRRAASAGPTGGSAPAACWRRRSCRRPGRRPTGTRLSIEMSAPSAQPLAACSARAARRHRSSAGSGWPRSCRAQHAVVAALEVQRVAPVDQHEHRLQQVVAVGAPADDVQEQVELGRRGNVVDRVMQLVHAGRRVESRAHADRRRRRRGARRPSLRRSGPGRRASRAARSRAWPAAGSARRARAGRAASRTAPPAAGSRRAPRASARRGRRSAARRRASAAAHRPAASAPGRAWCRAAPSAQLAARCVAAQLESGADAARATGRRRDRQPAGQARRRLGGGARRAAAASPRQRRDQHRRAPPRTAHAHRSTCSRASVSRSTSLAASRPRASRQTRRASSRWPLTHSTSPRCAAISASGRARRPGAAAAAPRRGCPCGIRPSRGCR